jgi:hypothetical protein
MISGFVHAIVEYIPTVGIEPVESIIVAAQNQKGKFIAGESSVDSTYLFMYINAKNAEAN